MGTYTGSNNLADVIEPGNVSAEVRADPEGTTPGEDGDTLYGGWGEDFLNGGGGSDLIYGGDSNDTTMGEDGNDYLEGGLGSDWLYGGAGNDTLNADAGTIDKLDLLDGGDGDDTYFINEEDEVAELRNDAFGGVDTVFATKSHAFAEPSFTIGFGIENLTLMGAYPVNGKGNDLDNNIIGNNAANVLGGGAGDDYLAGQNAKDVLRGATGNDKLEGGAGKDRLSGGAGNDKFVFGSAKAGSDLITDFHNKSSDNDRFVIDASGFKGGLDVGRLSRDQFQTSKGHEARDSDVRFIFDTRNETFWFDKNGDANGGQTLIADMQSNAEVTYHDILLI